MQYAINEDRVVWRMFQGEVVLLDLTTGHYYDLNKTASLVWSALRARKAITHTVRKIARQYAISLNKAHRDVMALVRMLEKEGLIAKKD